MTLFKNKIPKPRNLKLYLSVIIFYFAVSLIITFPLILNVRDSFAFLAGSSENLDGSQSDVSYWIWIFWWSKKALFELKVNPFFSNYLFYPTGINLLPGYDNYINVLLSLLLQPFFGVILSYNLIIILNFVFTGLAAFIFSRWFLKNNLSSLFSGLYVMSSTYMLYRGFQHPNLQNPGFSFLFILSYLVYIKSKSLRTLFLTLLFEVLTLLSSIYYLSFSVIICLLIAMFLSTKVINNSSLLAYRLGRYLIPILLLPWAIFIFFQISTAKSLLSVYMLNSISLWSNDLFGFLMPSGNNLLFGKLGEHLNAVVKITGSIFLEKNNFVGLLSIVSFIFILRSKDIKWKKFIVCLIIAAYILSMGPFLFVLGKSMRVILPYPLLYLVNPLFLFLRAPSRFTIYVILFLSICLGSFLTRVIPRKPPVLKLFFISAFLFLIVLESSVYPVSTYKLKNNKFFDELSKSNRENIVFDLPMFSTNSSIYKKYMLYQTLHQAKMLNGFNTTVNSSEIGDQLERRYKILSCKSDLNNDIPVSDLGRLFREDKINYLVFHKDLLCFDKIEKPLYFIKGAFPMVYSDDELDVYKVT